MAVLDVTSAPLAPARLGRWLLALVAGLLYGLGWTAGQALTLTVASAVWSASLVRLGWREARRPRTG